MRAFQMHRKSLNRRGQSDAVGSGGGGIRTHGRLAPTTVFKTVPIDHSGTPPAESHARGGNNISGSDFGNLLLTDLVDDVVGDEYRHIYGHRKRDRVAWTRIYLDEFPFVPDSQLGEIGVLTQLVDIDIL
jgi:hypothetical protein